MVERRLEIVQVLRVVRAAGHHRNLEHIREQIQVNRDFPLLCFIPQIQAEHHGDAASTNAVQAENSVQVGEAPLQGGGAAHHQDAVRHSGAQKIAGQSLPLFSRSQAVRAGNVRQEVVLPAVAVGPHSRLHRGSGPVSGGSPPAGETVENGGFARVGAARQGDQGASVFHNNLHSACAARIEPAPEPAGGQ